MREKNSRRYPGKWFSNKVTHTASFESCNGRQGSHLVPFQLKIDQLMFSLVKEVLSASKSVSNKMWQWHLPHHLHETTSSRNERVSDTPSSKGESSAQEPAIWDDETACSGILCDFSWRVLCAKHFQQRTWQDWWQNKCVAVNHWCFLAHLI